ncbi:hypothetical protein [Dyadobacter sp. BHUBP1]|uniref:hypothetical protein n=1 Tax=Dyadobacter sp. BHUBP1 TaxID=3424178 RepID=UPI003D33BE55
MTLIQKLPWGLALAACMMMSSCSQENVAEPEREKLSNGFSAAHGIPVIIPYIPTTNGPAGDNMFAPGWSKYITFNPDDLVKYATGTSTVTHLWGDPSTPWLTPLLAPLPNANKVITVMYQKGNFGSPGSTESRVKTTIKNLKPGHKYAVTILGASTIRMLNGQPTQYAPAIGLEITNVIHLNPVSNIALIDLVGKECEWVSKTITFEAKGTEADLYAYCTSTAAYYESQQSFFHYANIFVGDNAVKEIFQ